LDWLHISDDHNENYVVLVDDSILIFDAHRVHFS